jgi:haloacetate dehalogenase
MTGAAAVSSGSGMGGGDESPLPIAGLFEGFAALEAETARVRFAGVTGGIGVPVLLLHGYPETHAAWHEVAPSLTGHHTVIVADLPGYGRSLLVDTGAWDKREVAAELLALMRGLGHERFHVVGHDRGARVGYRLALDHPSHVISYSSLAVVPILDVRPAVDWEFAKAAFHWFFFLQPSDLVAKLLASDPDAFLDATLNHMAGSLDRVHPAALADYRAAFRRPSVRAAIVKDYQASEKTDLAHDLADRAAGRKIDCPVMVLWPEQRLVAEGAESGAIAAGDVCRRWAVDVSAAHHNGGHLVPEHAGSEVVRAILPFFGAAEARLRPAVGRISRRETAGTMRTSARSTRDK